MCKMSKIACIFFFAKSNSMDQARIKLRFYSVDFLSEEVYLESEASIEQVQLVGWDRKHGKSTELRIFAKLSETVEIPSTNSFHVRNNRVPLFYIVELQLMELPWTFNKLFRISGHRRVLQSLAEEKTWILFDQSHKLKSCTVRFSF